MKSEARVSNIKGLDNIQDPHNIGTDMASVLTNFLISSEGVLHTRPGYKSLYEVPITAACGDLAISGGHLVRVSSGGLEDLGVMPGTVLRSTSSQGRTFVSSEDFIGVVGTELREVMPRTGIRVIPTEGTFPKGTYMFSAVGDGGYLPSPVVSVQLDAPGGFLVVPETRGRVPAELYMTVSDGTELFFAVKIPSTGATIGDSISLSHPLLRQYLNPMPPGVVLSEVGGSLITAMGANITCSAPLDYEAYDPMKGVYTFPNEVTMVEECTLGVTYIGTTKELYLAKGASPEDWVLSVITPVGVVANSAVKMRVKLPSSPAEETVVIFTLADGSVVAGRNNEETVNLTEQKVQALKTTAHGAIVLDDVNYTIY